MASNTRKYAVLVIESDASELESLRRVLDEAGFKVLTAGGGLEALEILETAAVDLIVCEILLSKSEGFSLYDRLKRDFRTREIPFLFLTDRPRGSLREELEHYRQGIDDYLTRPFNPAALAARARSLIARREASVKIIRQDTLTGLLNREGLEHGIKRELSRVDRYDRHGSLVLLRVDDFDLIDERFGPVVGDTVLITLAELLRKHTRSSDIIGRYALDVFLSYLPESDDSAAVEMVARIAQAFAASDVGAQGAQLTFSAGVAVAHRTASLEFSVLIARAGTAVLEAQKLGKGRAVVWSNQLNISPLFPGDLFSRH